MTAGKSSATAVPEVVTITVGAFSLIDLPMAKNAALRPQENGKFELL